MILFGEIPSIRPAVGKSYSTGRTAATTPLPPYLTANFQQIMQSVIQLQQFFTFFIQLQPILKAPTLPLMKPLRLIAVWLLLLALPLQGVAAFTPSARCADVPASHAMHDAQQNHHGAAAQAHDHNTEQPQHDNGQPTDQANGHSCCHHVFSGVPSTAIPGTPVPPHAVTPRVSLLFTLYIPELPQRPPRA